MKKTLALLLAVLLALCAAGTLAEGYPRGGTITTTSVNLRYGPSTNTRVVCRLTEGDFVMVLGESVPIADTWFYVRTQDGLTGYVHESLIDVSGAPSGMITMPTAAPAGEAERAAGVIERVLESNRAIFDAGLEIIGQAGEYGGVACAGVSCSINGRYFGDFLITAAPDAIVLSGFRLSSGVPDGNLYWIYDWDGWHQQSYNDVAFEQWALQQHGDDSFIREMDTDEFISEQEKPPVYGLAADKLATRTGPGTEYKHAGTYNVKGQWLRVLSRAWSEKNKIWWVKVEIPYRGETRTLWTGYKRFDSSTLKLEDIPVEAM